MDDLFFPGDATDIGQYQFVFSYGHSSHSRIIDCKDCFASERIHQAMLTRSYPSYVFVIDISDWEVSQFFSFLKKNKKTVGVFQADTDQERAVYIGTFNTINTEWQRVVLYLCAGYFNLRFDGLIVQWSPDTVVKLLVGVQGQYEDDDGTCHTDIGKAIGL